MHLCPAMSAWLETKLASRHDWAPGLVTLKLEGSLEPFEAGQWANIGIELDGEWVRRAYSLASAPGAPPELYLTLVPGGRLTPRLLELRPGDPIQIERKPQGFFTLRWLPPAKDLWLVATGTGLAPYVSMLRAGEVLSRFERVVVVHGVRQVADLSYRDEIQALARYVPAVSREPNASGVEHGRITTLLESGALERSAGLALDPERSHVMLCGNPQMIEEVSALLAARGLRKHRQRKPGHVTAESFW